MTQTVSIDINSQLLARAQIYSKKMGSDLSHFIETLLYQVISKNEISQVPQASIKPINQLSPFVQSLCGVIKGSEESYNDIDGNDARLQYLKENI